MMTADDKIRLFFAAVIFSGLAFVGGILVFRTLTYNAAVAVARQEEPRDETGQGQSAHVTAIGLVNRVAINQTQTTATQPAEEPKSDKWSLGNLLALAGLIVMADAVVLLAVRPRKG